MLNTKPSVHTKIVLVRATPIDQNQFDHHQQEKYIQILGILDNYISCTFDILLIWHLEQLYILNNFTSWTTLHIEQVYILKSLHLEQLDIMHNLNILHNLNLLNNLSILYNLNILHSLNILRKMISYPT